MRTTVTLDPDVAERIQQASLSGKRSQKAIINEALRSGLGLAHEQKVEEQFRVRPIRSAFRSGVDIGKLNQLADEVEAESYVQKERGK